MAPNSLQSFLLVLLQKNLLIYIQNGLIETSRKVASIFLQRGVNNSVLILPWLQLFPTKMLSEKSLKPQTPNSSTRNPDLQLELSLKVHPSLAFRYLSRPALEALLSDFAAKLKDLITIPSAKLWAPWLTCRQFLKIS